MFLSLQHHKQAAYQKILQPLPGNGTGPPDLTDSNVILAEAKGNIGHQDRSGDRQHAGSGSQHHKRVVLL